MKSDNGKKVKMGDLNGDREYDLVVLGWFERLKREYYLLMLV